MGMYRGLAWQGLLLEAAWQLRGLLLQLPPVGRRDRQLVDALDEERQGRDRPRVGGGAGDGGGRRRGR